eukprot:PhM_4_TR10882/c0_g1_i1/m.75461
MLRRTFTSRAAIATTRRLNMLRSTVALYAISEQEYIPRAFPIKATTGLAGLPVEPLWKAKLLAASTELEMFVKTSDIPKDSSYFNITMTLVKRIFKGIEVCQDDWARIEKEYFWGWPVEYILQITWREIETAQRWNEFRLWELDPDAIKEIAKEEQGIGLEGNQYIPPFMSNIYRDYKKRKQTLSNEEMAELKRLDTERMARETMMYKERKQRIQDDLDKARGELLRKFLNKRMMVEPDLKKMQPGRIWSDKSQSDIIRELKDSNSAAKKELE